MLTWKSCPVIDDYPKSVLLIAILAAVIIAVSIGFRDVWFVLLTAVLLAISLIKYFAPSTYILEDEKIKVILLGFTKEYKWSSFRNYNVSSVGVYLSPFKKPSPLDPFRGCLIRFGNSDRGGVRPEQVIEFIGKKIGETEDV
jgi:cell division protein FtsW (lipid II flippase)